MKKVFTAAGLTIAAVIMGCVVRTEHTINAHITLDIRHIEEQADDLLDFIDGSSDELPAPEKTSMLQQALDFLNPIETVYAAELKNTSSDKTTALAKKMRARHDAVDAFVNQGCFGENNRGYLELRECDGLADADARNNAQKLMAEENKDRKELYAEIARLNQEDGVSVSTVEAIFHGQRFKRASKGEAFQLPPSGEFFTALQDTAQAKSLGADYQPGAWVVMP
ncbi:MAG: DUF1318 domain-containing protein [Candidatus Hydrogenedens sp.]|nr:DUF1318 domain-containing protein [Candidatus Hydrogenedens sp.]